MKKLLLALILVVVMAGTASAYPNIFVNNVCKDIQYVVKDDHIYLPLRDIAEALGCEVNYQGQYVHVNTVKLPNIKGGSVESQGKVLEALLLLQKMDAPDYDMVCRNANEITISENNIYYKDTEAYAYTTGDKSFMVSPKLIEKSLEKIASTMVHESCHLVQHSDERNAYLHEITALQLLNASQSDIDETYKGKVQTGKQ